jgi:hypothetical protein
MQKNPNLPGDIYSKLSFKKLAQSDKLNEPAEGKFLVIKFEFGGSFVVSLEGNCYEL